MALDWNGMSISDIGNNNGKKYNELEETTIWHGEDDNLKIANNARKQRKAKNEKTINKFENKKFEFTGIVGGGFSISFNYLHVNGKTNSYFEVASGEGFDIGAGYSESNFNIITNQKLTINDYKNKVESNNLNIGRILSYSRSEYSISGNNGTEIFKGIAGLKLGVSTQHTILQFQPVDAFIFIKDNANMVFRRLFYETNYYPFSSQSNCKKCQNR